MMSILYWVVLLAGASSVAKATFYLIDLCEGKKKIRF